MKDEAAQSGRGHRGQRKIAVGAAPCSPLPSTHFPALASSLLCWSEVNRTHRIRGGVYQREGRLISLLTDFGRINRCYPDRLDQSGETISYTGDGRRGDQYLNPANRALFAAIESGHAVPLFNKLSPGRWQHMGFWRVNEGRQVFDREENRMLWRFTLKRVRGSEPGARSRKAKAQA